MRVWTLHPKYLDRQELLASWNEGLEALDILSNPRKYRRFYAGLSVFRVQCEPVYALTRYLEEIAKEGKRRGLDIDTSHLPKVPADFRLKIPVSLEHVETERKQLARHLAWLSRWHVRKFEAMRAGRVHPLFFVQPGGRPSTWEVINRIGHVH